MPTAGSQDSSQACCDWALWPRKAIQSKPLLLSFLVLSAWYVLNSLLWHKIDQRPPRWDESTCLMLGQHSYQALQHGKLLEALCLKGVTDVKPGLVPFLSALSYFIIGDSESRATFLLNLVSFLLIFYSLLRLARDLTGQISVGVLACLFFWNLPLIIVWTHYYQLDLPLTAAVCTTIWLCVALDKCAFQGWLYPVLLAVTIAVGMGTKHLYPGFVLGALVLLVIRAVVQRGWPLRVSLRGRWLLLACLAAGVALGTAYHVINWHIVYEQFLRSRDAQRTGGSGTPPSVWICLYPLIANFPISLSWWIAAVGAGTLVLVVHGRWLVAYVVMAVVGGFACVAEVASYPMPNYLYPIVPFLTLSIAAILAWPRLPGLPGACLAKFRLATVCLLSGVLLYHQALLTMGTGNPLRIVTRAPGVLFTTRSMTSNPFSMQNYWSDVYQPGNTALQAFPKGPDGLGDRPWLCVPGNTATLPFPHYWPAEEMLTAVAAVVRTSAAPHSRSFLVGYNSELYSWLCGDYFQYKRLQLRLQDLLALGPIPVDSATADSPGDCLLAFDFLLLKSGPVYAPEHAGTLAAEKRQRFANQIVSEDYRLVRGIGFVPLARFDLPDGSEGTVWISRRVSPMIGLFWYLDSKNRLPAWMSRRGLHLIQ